MNPTPTPPSDTPITDAFRAKVIEDYNELRIKMHHPLGDVFERTLDHARTLERAARRLADALEALTAARRKVDYERSYGGPGGCQVNEADLHKASGEADTALAEWHKLEAGR